MKDDFVIWTCNTLGVVTTALQTEVVFKYIQLGLAILAILISLAFNIWKWYKMAMKDGKIDIEEIEELTETVEEHIKSVEEKKGK